MAKRQEQRDEHVTQKQPASGSQPQDSYSLEKQYSTGFWTVGIYIQNGWKMTKLVFLPQNVPQLQFLCNSTSMSSRLVLCHLQI